MASDAQLLVRLEARMDKYEKALKGAEESASKTVNKIEDTFKATTLGTSLGNWIDRTMKTLVDTVEKAIRDAIEKFRELQGVAEATGIALQDAFAIEKVLGPGGASAFEKIAEQLDQIKRGGTNYLSKLFDENGIKNVKTAQEAMEQIRNIFNDVASIQVKEITKGLGFTDEQVRKLRELPGSFDAATKAAAAGLPDLARIAQAGQDFEDLWKKGLTAVKLFLAETFQDMKVPVADFIAQTIRGLQVVVEAFGLLADLRGDSLGADKWKTMRDNIAAAAKEVDEFAAKSRQFGPRLSEMSTPPKGTGEGQTPPKYRAPSLGSKSSGGSDTDRVTGVERFLEGQRKSTAEAETQLRLLGASNAEYQTALALTQAKEAAQRDVTRGLRESSDLTDAETAKIREQVAIREKAKQTVSDTIALQNFAGNMLVDSLMQATEAGAKFADIMAGVAKQIARAALQALILGQGPLAGLFGTGGGQAGQTGGLIGGLGSLLKALPKYATGGVVPGSGPVPIMAHGGEVVVPKAVAQRGGLGASFAPIYNIDARGAQLGVAEQIAAALSANNRALQTNLPAMIRSAQSRGAIR